MTTLLDANNDAPIYPAFYFRASPTYDDWAKLTARDVHGLKTTPEFEAQGIHFHLNHPIRFVRLIATITGIERVSRFLILTLDDHSGATIEAKITCLTPADIVAREAEDTSLSASNTTAVLGDPSTTSIATIAQKIQAVTAAGVRETTVENVEVAATLGNFDVLVNGEALDIGGVVKAKCTLGKFRGEMQLEVKRISIIKDTNEEVAAWADTARYKQTVLGKPWRLSSRVRRKFRERVEMEAKRERDYERRKKEHEEKKAVKKKEFERKVRGWEEREERKRREREKLFNEGALI